jgi:hypothetical protein
MNPQVRDLEGRVSQIVQARKRKGQNASLQESRTQLRCKPAHWTRADRDYAQIRIHMQTLFNGLAIETPLAA